MKKTVTIILLMISIALSCGDANNVNQNKIDLININLDHLNFLSESITFASEEVLIIHIYSEYPDYVYVAADGEGISAVDDVARAVLVYLKYYEQFGGDDFLLRAKKGLRFILSMQASDGEFYNFINEDHTINRNGITSIKSFNWWAIRAIRAMAYGYKVFNLNQSTFADSLKTSLERTFPHIDIWISNYGNYNLNSPYKTPGWLINQAGDQTSELVLGLIDYFHATGDEVVKEYIRKLTNGLVDFQIREGNFAGAHLSWQNIWHAWGAHQVQAIAKAYKIFNDENWLVSINAGAGFYSKIVLDGHLNELEFRSADSVNVKKFPQIAYGIHAITSGLMEAFLVTGNDDYRKNMNRALEWFSGQNAVNVVMYDSTTGRTFDGIGENGVNRNSGAESTIEALLTFLELKEKGFL
ncbi:MAG: hypothetical protein IIB39_08090 [Candidatus Marinimicrobia bacterium]|nr:hypothetical protein [Candidatus Neomarinimicrobiota bacterium]